ncbi:MAG: acylphosphatase [Lachnospiraceae bacterium]|nr:acylphosphatase [Lachnospiraceae bacterium]
MAQPIVRKHILFYGRVQGVGFRYYAKYRARLLSLTGWVRNCYDGSVEMEVQGREADIRQMIGQLSQDSWIRIDRLEEKDLPLEEERDFHTRM